jgi:predicted DNA-binding protein with PD1-like motif
MPGMTVSPLGTPVAAAKGTAMPDGVAMKAKVLSENAAERTTALVFDPGDNVMQTLGRYVVEHNVTAARFTAVGAFSEATLGFFDVAKQDYEPIVVREQVEVLALIGDVATCDGIPTVHAHAVLGRRDGSACGGHLLEARVRPTLELMLVQSAATLAKSYRREFGLALIDLAR